MNKKYVIGGLIVGILVGFIIPWQATLFILFPGFLLWKLIIPKKPRPVASGNIVAYLIALSIWFVAAYYLADAVGF